MGVHAAILTSVLSFPAASGWLWGLVSALLLNKQRLCFHMDHCHEKTAFWWWLHKFPWGKRGKLKLTLTPSVNTKFSWAPGHFVGQYSSTSNLSPDCRYAALTFLTFSRLAPLTHAKSTSVAPRLHRPTVSQTHVNLVHLLSGSCHQTFVKVLLPWRLSSLTVGWACVQIFSVFVVFLTSSSWFLVAVKLEKWGLHQK